MTTRNLKSVLLTYEDDTSVELEVVDQQGFHRVSEYVGDRGRFIMHEIFLTYGEQDGIVGESPTD
jgi:hypothetical protein